MRGFSTDRSGTCYNGPYGTKPAGHHWSRRRPARPRGAARDRHGRLAGDRRGDRRAPRRRRRRRRRGRPRAGRRHAGCALHLGRPALEGRGGGAIIHIASSAAYTLPGSLLHYGVSKAALIAYSKGLATELAPHGVRVNTITPGSIQSPGGDSAREQIAATIGVEPAALLASIPVGHIGRPDDIAEAVAYLVSDRASFIIGANLIIDGGELPRT